VSVKALGERRPRIDPSAWISEAAYVVGDVEVGRGSTVWPGAVIRADFASVRLGAHVHVEDNCVLHGGTDLVVGDDVTIGHGAVVHCSAVGEVCLIGNNATLLDGARVGRLCVVAAGSVVLSGADVPDESFVTGTPGRVRALSPGLRAMLEAQRHAGLTGGGYRTMAERYRQAGL
jgi:carbonic anhydrase/acetyltransferase-like protein (isoleucine patch superfamily)